MSSRKFIVGKKKILNQCLSSSTIEIDIADESNNKSIDEDSNSQINQPISGTTEDEYRIFRRRKHPNFKNPKSHRSIEKQRRDRMNRSLDILLELIPHKKSESQRRIEKTEIVEMAIKYVHNLASSTKKSSEPIDLNKKSNLKIDAYRCGYHNGSSDTYEYTENHLHNNSFLPDLIHYIKENESQLKDLKVVPDKKGKISLSKKIPHASCDPSKSDDNLCATSDVRSSDNHENFCEFLIDEQQNSIQQTKVPIFALHPSGTHYIPMCIDSSIVIHAFNNKSQSSSSSINEQSPCHPVSIPVNFNPISGVSDPYELDIQNINVIGTRHQTSVRPN